MAKRSKNQIRRDKAKQRKLAESIEPSAAKNEIKQPNIVQSKSSDEPTTEELKVLIIEPESSVLLDQYKSVFQQFEIESTTDRNSSLGHSMPNDAYNGSLEDKETRISGDDEESDAENIQLSARQIRKRNKVSLAALKALSNNPSVVEATDTDAKDPFLLVHLKLQLNAVPVPQHWSSKREYLSGRKGIEKLPFQLPKYIADTGIQDMRNVLGDDSRTLKQLQRERVQPKMGKLDIDYQKLHDAFFKFQSKPRLYSFGDIYYEGREATDDYTEQIQHMKPGVVSAELKEAIGITGNASDVAPPWVSVMERLGKPPSYSDFLIPGLDVPYSNTGYILENGIAELAETHMHWGRLHEVEDDDSEEESESESEDENNVPEYDNVLESSQDEEEERVEISEYGKFGALVPKSDSEFVEETTEESTPGSKLLYQILEQASTEKSGLLNADKKYQI